MLRGDFPLWSGELVGDRSEEGTGVGITLGTGDGREVGDGVGSGVGEYDVQDWAENCLGATPSSSAAHVFENGAVTEVNDPEQVLLALKSFFMIPEPE